MKKPRACSQKLYLPPTCCRSAQKVDPEIRISRRQLDKMTPHLLLNLEGEFDVGAID
jgi:hypothetical protein